MSPPKDLEMVKPIERILHSGLFGPWEQPPGIDLSELPPGLNPARHRAWGADTFQVFPNYVILVWERGWYLTTTTGRSPTTSTSSRAPLLRAAYNATDRH